MFKLNPNPTFDFTAPIRAAGHAEALPLQLTGRHMGAKAHAAWSEGFAGRTDAEILGDVICGWRGVVVAEDLHEGDVPFSPEALAQLLDAYPGASTQILAAWREALFGGAAKN